MVKHLNKDLHVIEDAGSAIPAGRVVYLALRANQMPGLTLEVGRPMQGVSARLADQVAGLDLQGRCPPEMAIGIMIISGWLQTIMTRNKIVVVRITETVVADVTAVPAVARVDEVMLVGKVAVHHFAEKCKFYAILF